MWNSLIVTLTLAMMFVSVAILIGLAKGNRSKKLFPEGGNRHWSLGKWTLVISHQSLGTGHK